MRTFILMALILPQARSQVNISQSQFQQFDNVEVSRRFPMTIFNAGKGSSEIHCTAMCMAQERCKGFWLERGSCYLILANHWSKRFLLTGGSKTVYLPSSVYAANGCVAAHVDIGNGKDIGAVEASQVDQCMEECKNTEGCAAAVLPNWNTCYKKDESMLNQEWAGTARAGIFMDCNNLDMATLHQGPMSCHTNGNWNLISALSLGYYAGRTYQHCKNHCRNKPGCIGANLVIDGNCYLYGSTDDQEFHRPHVIGVMFMDCNDLDLTKLPEGKSVEIRNVL